jgi:hypothetical protein
MGLLEKIAWRTRKWNLKINILDIFIHDGDGCWGFTFLEVVHDFKPRALLAFEFRLPNGGNIKQFSIDNWDFLFLRSFLYNQWEALDERRMWSGPLSKWDEIKLNILSKIL